MTVTTAVVVLPRRVAVWASRRAVARTSVTGIELACALCAAVWFSAGTPLTALAGGAALGGGYLARRVGGQLAVGAFDGWLASICAIAGELAVYAGLAAGAAPGERQVWALATAAAVLLGMRKVARLMPPGPPGPPRGPRAPGEPAGGPGRRTRPGPGRPGRARPRAARGRAGRRHHRDRGGLRDPHVPARPYLVGRGRAGLGGRRAPAGEALIRPADDAPGDAPDRLPPAAIAAARDDGPIARFAGALVRGQLVPLPPAVAGLTATVLLATLGLHGLAGLVLLTPVAAMLLAAPGSAHPHDGPLDWLTPLVIQAGQYAYLAALGFAKGVPGPLIFALIGLVAVRQLDAAYRARYPMPAGEPRGGIGWEGRMLAAGVGAMLGVGPLTYLALTVYLMWLVSSGSLASWLAIRARSRGVHRPSLGS